MFPDHALPDGRLSGREPGRNTLDVPAAKKAFAFMLALLFVLALGGLTQAFAAVSGVAVTSVNLRAGPSTRYPVVIVMPQSASLAVHGCVSDRSWCDVSWGGSRGWVSANYIYVIYNGRRTVLTTSVVPAIGLATVAFTAAYWNTHYHAYPWHGHWNHYHRDASRSVTAGCGDRGCGAAAVTRGPHGGGRAAVGGINDNGSFGGAAVTRGPHGGGRAAIGGCGPEKCAGASVTRGPRGNIRTHHGSFDRP